MFVCVNRIAAEVEATIGLDCTECLHASAKSGIGIKEILEAIVERVSTISSRR